MARPKTDPALIAKALGLVDAGKSPQEAADEVGGLSWRTIYNAKRARDVAQEMATSSPTAAGHEPAPTPPPSPATARDKKIDEMIACSRTWQRVQEALVRALSPYPEAGRAVAKALREIQL